MKKNTRKNLISTLIFIPLFVLFQLWGNTPENYAAAVKDIKRFKPDGVDINIGCSVRNVLSSGHCSSLIKDPELVKRIIDAVKSEAGNIPVSVKTRIGYDSIITNEWFSFILSTLKEACNIALDEILGFIKNSPDIFDEIAMVCLDKKTYNMFQSLYKERL